MEKINVWLICYETIPLNKIKANPRCHDADDFPVFLKKTPLWLMNNISGYMSSLPLFLQNGAD